MKKNLPKQIRKKEESDDDNPFLCNDCKKLGYCRLAAEEHRKKAEAERLTKAIYRMEDAEIRNLVPLNRKDITSLYTRQHLETADLAFHQEDYETAILHYQAVLEGCPSQNTTHVFLAVCFYFMKDFESAIRSAFCYLAEATQGSGRIEKFIVHCQNCLTRQKAEAEIQKMQVAEARANEAVRLLLQETSVVDKKVEITG